MLRTAAAGGLTAGSRGHEFQPRISLRFAPRLVALAVVIASASSLTLPASAVEPAYSFRNPFHPEQCERAIRFADRLLEREPANRRGRLIRAEGYLCKGLNDDPVALDQAIFLLSQSVAEQPDNFFARLELADAEYKRFPLSGRAEAALEQLGDLLHSDRLGAARHELESHVTEKRAAAERRVARTLPLLQRYGAHYQADTLPPPAMAELVSLLVLTGTDGVARAAQLLDAFLARHPDATLATLYRGEILLARGAVFDARSLYREAANQLCRANAPQQRHDCSLARRRITELERFGSEGGGPDAMPAGGRSRKEESR